MRNELQIDELNKQIEKITSDYNSKDAKQREMKKDLKKSRIKSDKLQSEIQELKKELAGKYALKVEIKKADVVQRKLHDDIKTLRKDNQKLRSKCADFEEKFSSTKKDLSIQIKRHNEYEKRTKAKESKLINKCSLFWGGPTMIVINIF